MNKRNRSRNLTDSDIGHAVALLDAWEGKLTWNLLIDEIAKTTRVNYTRQALNAYEQIKLAFKLAKIRVGDAKANAPKKETLTPGQIEMLHTQNERLKAKVERLEKENNNLLSQFALWAYNANCRGLSIEQLSSPLPPIDRGRTKERGVVQKARKA